ncbi:MAG: ATP-dependent DNA helicase RecG [Patescibacteria group bacterium]|jgi:ATP-dependent DNA helicase RecG
MMLTGLHGVGTAIQQKLRRLAITTLTDLLYHFPAHYEDFSNITAITACATDQAVTILGTIKKISTRRSWKRRRFTITEATITDASGDMRVIWFNQAYIAEQLPANTLVYLSGKITLYQKKLVLNNPVYELYKTETVHTARIVPRYALTTGLTHKQLRYFIKQALQIQTTNYSIIKDWLPANILDQYQLLPITQALQAIHFPNSWAELEQAKYRLGFDELLLVLLFVQATRASLAKETAPSIPFAKTPTKTLVDRLPFQLTNDQRVAAWDIIKDLQHTTPMNRLLEGDVGSGKTVVAALAMYNVALACYQAVLMAPTELLAEQHYHTIKQLFSHTNINVGLWTRSKKIAASFPSVLPHPPTPSPLRRGGEFLPSPLRRRAGDEVGSGEIIIGTQALIQKNVHFPKLALVVVDEQHRFGVTQRQQLKQVATPRGASLLTPHLLSMTATPIPRSLALTIYGDLDLSLLAQLPKNRKPIITKLFSTEQRLVLQKIITEHLANQAQIYVVVPRIEEKDDGARSVQTEYKHWQKLFPNYRIAYLHGQLPTEEKQAVMEQFRAGKIAVLITTTVIEVGVDVPNATVMIIEGAEHFGLAQLHQLRGRVGRSHQQSYCYVCTDVAYPIKRLQYFVKNHNGFALADYDLKLRGPGAVYGAIQSGYFNQFKIATLSNTKQLQQVKAAAATLYPNIKRYPALHAKLQHMIKRVHLE